MQTQTQKSKKVIIPVSPRLCPNGRHYDTEGICSCGLGHSIENQFQIIKTPVEEGFPNPCTKHMHPHTAIN